jgi:hypothetical protein
MGSLSVGFLQSDDFVQNNMNKYSTELLNEVNEKIDSLDGKLSLSIEVYTSALGNDDAAKIISKVSSNFMNDYPTDFSEDRDLFESVKTSILNYCEQNSIKASDAQMNKAACFVVEEVNEVVGGRSSLDVKVFTMVQSRAAMCAICLAVILLIITTILLDVANYGRHRKYNYIGMGFTTAGFLMSFGILFVNHQDYVNNFKFTTITAYNLGIADCINILLNYVIIIGAVCFAIGLIILVLNYNYFRKKSARVKASRDDNSKMRKEYLEQYNAKKRQLFEKI